MAIDIECTNPDCGCRMQFETPPPGGEVTCPACGKKIPVEVSDGAAPERGEQDKSSPDEEYRKAEELAEQTVLDIEPIRGLPPVAQPVVAAPVESEAEAEEAEEAEVEPVEDVEERPIESWAGEANAAPAPPVNAAAARVKRKREIPPVLIVSAFSCSFLILLLIAKWSIQTGRFWGAKPEPPPAKPAAEKPNAPEAPPGDGWASEDEIAKKVGQRMAEWEKSRPDPKFVTVKKDGTANFPSIREALIAVESGGVVEIQDNKIYDEAMIGHWNSEDPGEKRIYRKRNIILRTASGHAGIRWPQGQKLEGYSNCLLAVGGDWTISGIVFIGEPSQKVSGIYAQWGGVDIRGCRFLKLRYGVMRSPKHEETEIRDSVFEDVYAVAMLSEACDIPNVVFHNNVVKNARGLFRLYRYKTMEGVPQSLAFSIFNNILVGVDDVCSGATMPKELDMRCDYNCYWKCGGSQSAEPGSQDTAPNVLEDRLKALRKAKQCDANSITMDPVIDKKFHIAENSPCRGKGKDGTDLGVNWERAETKVTQRSADAAKPAAEESKSKDHYEFER